MSFAKAAKDHRACSARACKVLNKAISTCDTHETCDKHMGQLLKCEAAKCPKQKAALDKEKKAYVKAYKALAGKKK